MRTNDQTQKGIFMKTLYLVIPCYNEEEVLPETSKRLLQKVLDLEAQERISPQSRILFVDDGSKDNTCLLYTSRCV